MVQILHDLILGLNRVWAVRGDTLVWRRRRSLASDSLGEPVVHRHKMLHLLFPLVGANEYLSSGMACAVATTSNCTTVSCVSRTEVIVGGCVATGGGPCWARAIVPPTKENGTTSREIAVATLMTILRFPWLTGMSKPRRAKRLLHVRLQQINDDPNVERQENRAPEEQDYVQVHHRAQHIHTVKQHAQRGEHDRQNACPVLQLPKSHAHYDVYGSNAKQHQSYNRATDACEHRHARAIRAHA